MKLRHSAILPALLAFSLSACGGGGGGGTTPSTPFVPNPPAGGSPTTDSTVAGAPSFDLVATEQQAGDTNPAVFDAAPSASTFDVSNGDTCHAKLFATSHDVVLALNEHTYFVLNLVQSVIAGNAVVSNGSSKTYQNVVNGVIRRFTITNTGSGSYGYELDVATNTANPSFVNVYSGTLTTTTNGNVTESTGQMTFNFTSLNTVYTNFTASGQINVSFDVLHDPSKPAQHEKKTLTFSLVNFVKNGGNAHGPRNGQIVHIVEPGVGGSMTFQDAMVLLCPSNPQNLVSNVSDVARWYVDASGVMHGRSDGTANGGALPSGDAWVGVDCYNNGVNGYWMMKVEDASGATAQGSEHANASGTPCDGAFGSVPALANNATDYAFAQPVSFPNEW